MTATLLHVVGMGPEERRKRVSLYSKPQYKQHYNRQCATVLLELRVLLASLSEIYCSKAPFFYSAVCDACCSVQSALGVVQTSPWHMLTLGQCL